MVPLLVLLVDNGAVVVVAVKKHGTVPLSAYDELILLCSVFVVPQMVVTVALPILVMVERPL